MPIWKIPGMSMRQTIERQVNMKGTSASAEVDCIKVDLEEDSDVEVGEGRYDPPWLTRSGPVRTFREGGARGTTDSRLKKEIAHIDSPARTARPQAPWGRQAW
jgi:hypothetical protein